MPPSRYSRFQNQSASPHTKTMQALARYPFRTKDLDFLILAGCSCLLTFLYHPALDQIQGSTKTSPKPTSSTTSSTPNSLSSFGTYSAVEPKRQSFRIEEEDT